MQYLTHCRVQSVLCVVGELIPKLSEVPPTLPRLSTSADRDLPPSPPTQKLTELPPSEGNHTRETREEGKRHKTAGDNVSHHVQFTPVDAQDDSRLPTSPLEHNALGLMTLPHSTVVQYPEALPSPLGSDSQHTDSGEPSRGRKLGFLRKQFSSSLRSPKRHTPQRVVSNGSPPSSRTTSPERSGPSSSCSSTLSR